MKFWSLALIFITTGMQAFSVGKTCGQTLVKEASSRFNLNGLKGKIVQTTDPFGLLAEGQFQVSVIEELPNERVLDSKLNWLKEPRAFKLVQDMHKLQVPVVFGKIPPGTTAEAFVLPPSYQMTRDVLASLQDKTHKNVLFLQPEAKVDVMAHELQHWLDYEDGTFQKFVNELVAFQKQAKISSSEFTTIQDAVVEIRGHGRQEITLRESLETNNSESVDYVSSIYRHYAEALVPILNRLEHRSPALRAKLLNLIQRYELKDAKL